jgi:hypothetical protein
MSAKTVVVVINESIATVASDLATLSSTVSGIPGALVFGTVAYEGSISPTTAPDADLTDGKVTLFINTASSPYGNETFTSTVFASPSDGDTFRLGNLADTAHHQNTITFNDGTTNILILAPGEFATIRWSNGLSQWLKISGV